MGKYSTLSNKTKLNIIKIELNTIFMQLYQTKMNAIKSTRHHDSGYLCEFWIDFRL